MQGRIRNYSLPILSGILIGTSYIPFPPWATLFALVPLWHWWLKQTSLKRIWWGGWCTQFVLSLIGFNWVAHTVHEFGHLPWPVAVLVLVIFCAFANLQVPLAGLLWCWLCHQLKINRVGALWLLVAFGIFTEIAYPMIFDWHMGYMYLAAGLPAAQVAELIGFRGLSAMTYLFNGLILAVVLQPKWRAPSTALLVVLFLGLNGLGHYLKTRLPSPDAKASIELVQANIGNLEKQEAEKGAYFRQSIIDTYLKLTESGLKTSRPDFVVWPETAFPHFLNEPYFTSTAYARQLTEFVQSHQIRLVTGGYGYNAETEQITNSMFFIGADGLMTDESYSKTVLLAFGEYMPGAKWFPVLQQINSEIGNFARGRGPEVRRLDSFKLGPLICYEGLFDDFARSLANKGAQILINITNDSWYGKWQQPFQHMYMTLARAIESRRPIIRDTNTGISTVALADGTILNQSPLHQPWQSLYDVPYYISPPKTFFMGLGYYFSWALIVVLAVIGIWRGRRARTS